jgi:CRISPR/Cas system-associated exonuclease Cas4 (RecB family)
MSNREWQLRNFGMNPKAPKDRRQIEELMTQTEEDFNRILTLHNEIARAISSKDDLNYHFVSEATAEMKKRASRVQSNLVLGLSSEDARVEVKAEPEMKDSLIKLCKEIRAFVTNPMIENPNTVDAQQLVRAKRDLEGLIQLSGLIKKDADKLSKEKH